MRVRFGLALLLLAVAGVQTMARANQSAAREAAQRAIPALEKAASGYVRQRGCFSCHHQGVPVLALTLARDRGLAVDPKVLAEQADFTHVSLTGGRDAYQQGRGQGGGVTTAGYALWTLEAASHKPDDTTAAVAEYLLRAGGEGAWRTTAQRPPSEASSFTSTFVALRGLRKWATEQQKERVEGRLAAVRKWLAETPAKDTEDRVFRLWSLKLAGAANDAVAAAAEELSKAQRPDGGWSQTDALESDAYATGSALVALRQTGSLAAQDPVYARGAAFLVKTQQADGTWHVVSRSKPFQPYFESGFPYGKDQWISMAGSAWAAAALLLEK
jgi:hypothetical protein